MPQHLPREETEEVCQLISIIEVCYLLEVGLCGGQDLEYCISCAVCSCAGATQLLPPPPCALCCKIEEAVAVLQAHQATESSHKSSAVAFLQ